MYLRFYVYAYLRTDGTPYYIGKGTRRRAWEKGKREFQPPADHSRILILEGGLTQVGALALERRMIRWYGRKDLGTGILRNRTDGGDGNTGRIYSDETRRKISESNKRRGPVSEETRRKIGDANRGRKMSDEQRKLVSESNRRREQTAESRRKKSEALKGRPKPPRSEEHCRKLSEAHRRRKH